MKDALHDEYLQRFAGFTKNFIEKYRNNKQTDIHELLFDQTFTINSFEKIGMHNPFPFESNAPVFVQDTEINVYPECRYKKG
jgi:hypothetical protein